MAERAERPDRAVIATDLAGQVVFWGAGAEELYGWTAGEALGRDIIDLTPTDMSRDEAARIMEGLRRGDTWSGEFLVRSKDGRRFVATVTDVPVSDDEGRLVGILGISRRSMYMSVEGDGLSRRRSDRGGARRRVRRVLPEDA